MDKKLIEERIIKKIERECSKELEKINNMSEEERRKMVKSEFPKVFYKVYVEPIAKEIEKATIAEISKKVDNACEAKHPSEVLKIKHEFYEAIRKRLRKLVFESINSIDEVEKKYKDLIDEARICAKIFKIKDKEFENELVRDIVRQTLLEFSREIDERLKNLEQD
jgi:polyhydroxyalkanoate synthesis regulator phasin